MKKRLARVGFFHNGYLQVLKEQGDTIINMMVVVKYAVGVIVYHAAKGDTSEEPDLTKANEKFNEERELALIKLNTEIWIYKKWLKSKKDIDVFVRDINSKFEEIKSTDEKIREQQDALFKQLKKEMIAYDRFLLIDDIRQVEPKKFKGRKARARFQKSYR